MMWEGTRDEQMGMLTFPSLLQRPSRRFFTRGLDPLFFTDIKTATLLIFFKRNYRRTAS